MYIGHQYYVYVIRHCVIQWGIDSRLPTARAPQPCGALWASLRWFELDFIYFNLFELKHLITI